MAKNLVRHSLFVLLEELKQNPAIDSPYKALKSVLKENKYFTLFTALKEEYGADKWQYELVKLFTEGYIEDTDYYTVAIPVGKNRYQYLMKTLNGVRIGGIVSEYKVPPVKFKDAYVFSYLELINFPKELRWTTDYAHNVYFKEEDDE